MIIAILEPNNTFAAPLAARLRRLLSKTCVISCLKSANELDGYLFSHIVDMVFLYIDFKSMYWMTLQSRLLTSHSRTKLVLVSDSDAYALDAIKARVHGYLLLPISDVKLMNVFEDVEGREKLLAR